MAKNVIVVGAPRSGTSMTALMFTKKGYFVTENEQKDLQEPNEYNPNGYWEAEIVKKCNAEVLRMAGFDFDNTWMFDSITEQQANKIMLLQQTDVHKKVVEQFNSRSPWIWKDPRLCYTIGYWWPILDQTDTRVLLLKRDPEEVYQSFLRINWINSKADKDLILKRIIDHMNFAEYSVNKLNIPHVAVDYSDYRTHPDKVAKKISQVFDIGFSEEDIGYDRKLKTSGLYGGFLRIQNKVSDSLPGWLRLFIKKLIPMRILKFIFPHKFYKQ